jgi:hypothetical protein
MTDDDLAARERELAETEVKIDRQDREAQALQRQLERDRVDAVRRLDLAEVRALDGQLDKVTGEVKVLKELRQMLRAQLDELQRAKAEQSEAKHVERHGPRPCSFLSVADRMRKLGLDAHLAHGVAMIVEEHQHAVTWSNPDGFLKTAKAYHLEREAANLGTVISMVGDRDAALSVALCEARTYCQHQAEARRAPPERVSTGDPFAAPS